MSRRAKSRARGRRRIRRLVVVLLGLAALWGAFEYDRRQHWQDRHLHAGWRVQYHVGVDLCRLLDSAGGLAHLGRIGSCRADLAARRARGEVAPTRPHLVLLLHGLGRSPRIFRNLEAALEKNGFEAVALAYPSLTAPITAHAEVLDALLSDLEGVERVSFVTHSLGGLVVRALYRQPRPWQERLAGGRLVMLAPPNQGSGLAERLGRYGLFRWVLGPSAVELAHGTGPDLPQPGLPTGVIAGVRGDGEGWNPGLDGDDDGIVGLAETRLESARDHVALPAFHSFIASRPAVVGATVNFLTGGPLQPATQQVRG